MKIYGDIMILLWYYCGWWSWRLGIRYWSCSHIMISQHCVILLWYFCDIAVIWWYCCDIVVGLDVSHPFRQFHTFAEGDMGYMSDDDYENCSALIYINILQAQYYIIYQYIAGPMDNRRSEASSMEDPCRRRGHGGSISSFLIRVVIFII